MKAYYLIIRTAALTAILVFLNIIDAISQSTDRNFVKTEELFTPVSNENSIDTIQNNSNRKRTTIAYFDGLGRLEQSIILSKSPSNKDIVQHIEYDGLGRQAKSFLPFTISNSNGAFVTDADLKQITFYAEGTNPDIPETAYPYNETRFEQSPLNRVLESASPGENWNLESGHTIKSHIGSNEVDEVKKWSVGSNGDILKSDSYPAGKLLKNITFDEDNNKSVSYTTTQGLTVLKRNVLNEQNLETYLDTYYVYNDLNLLVCVIMPNANTSQNTFTDFANAFRYKYDGKRRMVEKYLPGTEPVYYVYNKADKLVLEQDGNLRGGINKVWKFYKYDVFGRMINEGTYGYSGSRESLQQTLDNSTNRLYEIKEPGDFAYEYGYSHEAFPGNVRANFVYYYDYYDFNADGNALNEFNQYYKVVDGFLATIDKTPYGQITGKMIGNSEIEVFFYDMEGRIIQTKTENYYSTNKYYFNGTPSK
jgi:hypothetical protein